MSFRTPRYAAACVAAMLLTIPIAAAAPADAPPTEFDKVEEDWELVVATPDPVAVGPQVTTCMTPFAVGVAPFVAFNLNYRDRTTFQPGGMQLQVWSPAGQLLNTTTSGSAILNTAGETVTWTQRMRLIGGYVYYDIQDGRSTTWGQFGSWFQLYTAYPASPTSLMGYDPDISAERSGVTWQSNRARRLVLKRVRYYAGGSLIWTDETPRVVVQNESS